MPLLWGVRTCLLCSQSLEEDAKGSEMLRLGGCRGLWLRRERGLDETFPFFGELGEE